MKKLPRVVETAYIELGAFGVLAVHILDNGQKVIDQEQMAAFMDYLAGGGDLTKQVVDEILKTIEGIGK